MISKYRIAWTSGLSLLMSVSQITNAADITFSPGVGVTETYTDNYVTLHGSPTNFIKNGAGTTVMTPSNNVTMSVGTGSTTINAGFMNLSTAPTNWELELRKF